MSKVGDLRADEYLKILGHPRNIQSDEYLKKNIIPYYDPTIQSHNIKKCDDGTWIQYALIYIKIK